MMLKSNTYETNLFLLSESPCLHLFFFFCPLNMHTDFLIPLEFYFIPEIPQMSISNKTKILQEIILQRMLMT